MNIFFKLLKENIAFAHCDIPCGIYDPHAAQLAAHTVLRMTNLLSEVKREDETKAEHDIARVTRVKEKHSDLLEEELETLKNDYFKDEHFTSFPNLKELFDKALKQSAKARQGIDKEAAENTLSLVLEISEIFYKTKNVEPIRIKSVYPTGGEIVTYK